MSYALMKTVNGVDTIVTEGALPPSARRLDTDELVMALQNAPVALQRATGWWLVHNNPKPADTPTQTYDRYLTVVANVMEEFWAARNKTPAEVAAATAATNETDLMAKADAALAANDTFLALANPNNAAVVSHVQKLTRETSALIRLVIRKLDSTSGT